MPLFQAGEFGQRLTARFVGTFGGEPSEFRTIHAALFESWKREGSCKFDLLERDGAGRQHYKQCSQMNQLIALV